MITMKDKELFKICENDFLVSLEVHENRDGIQYYLKRGKERIVLSKNQFDSLKYYYFSQHPDCCEANRASTYSTYRRK